MMWKLSEDSHKTKISKDWFEKFGLFCLKKGNEFIKIPKGI